MIEVSGNSLRPLDRDHIRKCERAAVQDFFDHARSNERLEQLEEIYLAASKEAAELELELDATLASLIRYSNASTATLCRAAGVSERHIDRLNQSVARDAPDVEDAPVKLGPIAEKCTHAKERATAARALYYSQTRKTLDHSGTRILEVASHYVLRKAGSTAVACMLTAHGVPPILAQFMGRAFVTMVLGPQSRAERFLDISLTGHVLTEHVRTGRTHVAQELGDENACEDYSDGTEPRDYDDPESKAYSAQELWPEDCIAGGRQAQQYGDSELETYSAQEHESSPDDRAGSSADRDESR